MLANSAIQIVVNTQLVFKIKLVLTKIILERLVTLNIAKLANSVQCHS